MLDSGKLNRRTFLALSAAVAATLPGLSLAADFKELPVAQPTDNKAKVEVLEFFHYLCPHCRDFDPLLHAWVAKLPADVYFRRVPVTWGDPKLVGMARLYQTLEAIGETGRIHGLVFEAVQDKKLPLFTEAGAADWVASKGVDRKKFLDAYKSFGVNAAMNRVENLGRDYVVKGVPNLYIDGKYSTSASDAGSHENALKVADRLIARARTEKGRK